MSWWDSTKRVARRYPITTTVVTTGTLVAGGAYLFGDWISKRLIRLQQQSVEAVFEAQQHQQRLEVMQQQRTREIISLAPEWQDLILALLDCKAVRLRLAEPSLPTADKAQLASHLCRLAWARVLVSCYTSAYIASLYVVLGGVQLGLSERQNYATDELDEATYADQQAALKTLWVSLCRRVARDTERSASEWLKSMGATDEFEDGQHLRRWFTGLHQHVWSQHQMHWSNAVVKDRCLTAIEPLARAAFQDVFESPETQSAIGTRVGKAVQSATDTVLQSLKPKQTKAHVFISTMPSAAAYVTAVHNSESLLKGHGQSPCFATLLDVIVKATAGLPVA
eukprot:m.57429 g.57429  ORF g.57429 m.57429 type:complete len:338 (+) comp13726_c0_seq1:86-1099(+)